VVQALAGGSMDFGEASPAIFISAIANNLPIVAIGVHSAGNIARLVASPANAGHDEHQRVSRANVSACRSDRASYILLLMALHQGGLVYRRRHAHQYSCQRHASRDAIGRHSMRSWSGSRQASRIVKGRTGNRGHQSPKNSRTSPNIEFPFLLLTTAKMVSSRPENRGRNI